MAEEVKVKTGDVVEIAGIYKCKRCKKEFTFKKGDVVKDCDKCGDDDFILVKETK